MPLELTIFEYRLSAASIYFLPPNKKTSCVSKVDVSQFCMVINRSRVNQVLNWYHVLITGLDVHIQASDNPRTTLTVEKEEIVFWPYESKKREKKRKGKKTDHLFTVIVN